jgi:glycosyltransferase involved in cell wall biosynthesis
MLGYTFYERDNRVRRYAEALVDRGFRVDVIALQAEGQPKQGWVSGVRVIRLQKRAAQEKSKFTYLWKLLLFFVRSLIVLTREQIREPYDLIHVHSVPDFEVFAALWPKLCGSRIILDIHDIIPEFYASKFGIGPETFTFKMLVNVERLSAAFADHVIAANHIWEERLKTRSVAGSKCSTFLNYPDGRLFQRQGIQKQSGRITLVYPGSLNYHQGVDLAVRAFAGIKDKVPNADFHIYGSSGELLEVVKSLIVELGLQDRVLLKPPVSLDEMPLVLESADLGIVPKRSDGFGNEAFSTKILEFMAMGVPVVIPDTAVDRHYFNDGVVRFFQANDENSLAEAILFMLKNPEAGATLARNASEFVKQYSWKNNQDAYLRLVDSLVGSRDGGRKTEPLETTARAVKASDTKRARESDRPGCGAEEIQETRLDARRPNEKRVTESGAMPVDVVPEDAVAEAGKTSHGL